MTLESAAERYRIRLAVTAGAYGLRLWLALELAFIIGRSYHVYATPWAVVLAPIWLPIAAWMTWPLFLAVISRMFRL